MVKYCKCGCGTVITESKRFVYGHRVRLTTSVTKKKISDSIIIQHEIHKKQGKSYGFQSGEKNPMKNLEIVKKVKMKRKGQHNSPDTEFKRGRKAINKGKETSFITRRKQRISAIKRIERQVFNGEPMRPSTSKYETPILDNLERCFGYTILRQHKVLGRFLDGYCPVLRLAIEIDEPVHFNFNGELKEKDIRRQKEIEEEMGYTFLRIKVPMEVC